MAGDKIIQKIEEEAKQDAAAIAAAAQEKATKEQTGFWPRPRKKQRT